MRSLISLAPAFLVLWSCGGEATPTVAPASTAWTTIAHDPRIVVKQSESPDLQQIDYDVSANTLTVRKNFGAVIAWTDGQFTTLVAYSPLSSGATLVRVDCTTKAVVYAVPLQGIGGIDHSQYHNEVRVFVNLDLVKIVGEESGGRYEEIRRLADGSLIHVNQSFAAFHRPGIINVH